MNERLIIQMGEVIHEARQLLAQIQAMPGDPNHVVAKTSRALQLQCAISELDRLKTDGPGFDLFDLPPSEPVDHMQRFSQLEVFSDVDA